MGTMMSVAAWGTDSVRVARALDAARDSVDRIDSLIQRHVAFDAIDYPGWVDIKGIEMPLAVDQSIPYDINCLRPLFPSSA